eukprot:CAMPEP_0194354940 /NCGR_PEP_ID=MMETSP0174-20130528/2940_1 /TAXON_ID=216777 /ORGANISM="Proboscia alata, Strain PI-D3" /LENGTH=875 /DNA_ID=CAMNT_0039124019 /DNA_START=58 /DNA_END=2685 /DNA_ORIENTATION=+
MTLNLNSDVTTNLLEDYNMNNNITEETNSICQLDDNEVGSDRAVKSPFRSSSNDDRRIGAEGEDAYNIHISAKSSLPKEVEVASDDFFDYDISTEDDNAVKRCQSGGGFSFPAVNAATVDSTPNNRSSTTPQFYSLQYPYSNMSLSNLLASDASGGNPDSSANILRRNTSCFFSVNSTDEYDCRNDNGSSSMLAHSSSVLSLAAIQQQIVPMGDKMSKSSDVNSTVMNAKRSAGTIEEKEEVMCDHEQREEPCSQPQHISMNAVNFLYHDIMMIVFSFLPVSSLTAFSETARRPNFDCFYYLQLQLDRVLDDAGITVAVDSASSTKIVPKDTGDAIESHSTSKIPSGTATFPRILQHGGINQQLEGLSPSSSLDNVVRLCALSPSKAQELIAEFRDSNLPNTVSLSLMTIPQKKQAAGATVLMVTMLGAASCMGSESAQALLSVGIGCASLVGYASHHHIHQQERDADNEVERQVLESSAGDSELGSESVGSDRSATAIYLPQAVRRKLEEHMPQMTSGFSKIHMSEILSMPKNMGESVFPSAVTTRLSNFASVCVPNGIQQRLLQNDPENETEDEMELQDTSEDVGGADLHVALYRNLQTKLSPRSRKSRRDRFGNKKSTSKSSVSDTVHCAEEDTFPSSPDPYDASSPERGGLNRKKPSGCVGAYIRTVLKASNTLRDVVKERRKKKFEIYNEEEREMLSTRFVDCCSSDANLEEVVDLVRDSGIDVDAFYMGSDGAETCGLHTAAFNGSCAIIEFLCKGLDDCVEGESISDGGLCNIDCQDGNGWTALHFAAGANCVLAVEVLAKYGANLAIEAGNGYTPYRWSERLGNAEVMRILEDLGVNSNFFQYNNIFGPGLPLLSMASRVFKLIPSN